MIIINKISGETEDYKRRHILQQADVISKIDIVIFVKSKFAEVRALFDPDEFSKLSSEVEEDVRDKLTAYLS